jgi:hypothetical protein
MTFCSTFLKGFPLQLMSIFSVENGDNYYHVLWHRRPITMILLMRMVAGSLLKCKTL